MLRSILAVANADQNFSYPPLVYNDHFNTLTSLLISQCAKLYPTNPDIIDIIDPFVRIAPCIPSKGLIPLPTDYRNLLGAPSINVKGDASGECFDAPPITTKQEFQTAMLKGGCLRRPITIVSQSEFDYLTTSGYKKPTYNNPIAYFAGQKALKVCPYDVTKVDVMYIAMEKTYVYGYVAQPDDTFIFDINSSVESEWTSAAYEPLFRGLNHLYGAFSRDKSFSDWANLLSQISIV